MLRASTAKDNSELIRILDEFKHLQETEIDTRIVEIIVGDRLPTKDDELKIREIRDRLDGKFNTFILYTITHEVIGDEKQARTILEKIIEHKWNLSISLNRNIGILVAALDFLKNISPQLNTPTIISEDKVIALATASIKDKMTHTFDKIMLFKDLENEIERSKRYNTYFSVLMLDIDDFKSVNDKYGHIVGDHVIVEVSDTINRSIRISDRVYRYGGDEFIMLLLNTSKDSGLSIAGKIMESINALAIPIENQNDLIKVNVSISFTGFNQFNLQPPRSIIAMLDAGLYKAKDAGKKMIYECDDRFIDNSPSDNLANCS
jgi:diguanylate cyclase (GGDEF)-like protein